VNKSIPRLQIARSRRHASDPSWLPQAAAVEDPLTTSLVTGLHFHETFTVPPGATVTDTEDVAA